MSAPSPKTGTAPERRPEKRSTGDKLSVALEADLGRVVGWCLGAILVGLLLIIKLGTLAHWLGAGLIVLGAWNGVRAVQFLLHRPGTITIDVAEASLPDGRSTGRLITVKTTELRAAYFLRHAVPWPRTGPVLVIETDDRAFMYPRDWFANEASQRRLLEAVQHQVRGHATPTDATETPAEPAGA